jgi:hypothetical protein
MAGMARTRRPSVVSAARTVVGTLDADRYASVDPSGRVQLDGSSWSLDWWIGAEDRWHVPPDETSARQRLVGGAPVVETRVRVPSGDAVHRAYAARDASGVAVVVVEIENDSKVPFAVALAVRPLGLDGPGAIKNISAEGTEVRVDGKLALLAARAPGRRTAAAVDGDVAEVVFSGAAQPEAAVAARCREGKAQAAVVFPLAHTATLRVVLPLDGNVLDVAAVPSAAQVASGWRTHARRGARVELPDGRLQDAVDSTLCHLLLRPHSLQVAAALIRFGFVDESAAMLLGEPIAAADTDVPGQALLGVTAHWTLTRDAEFAERAVPVVANLVAALGRGSSVPDLSLGAIASGTAAVMLETVGEERAAEDMRRAGQAMAAAKGVARPAPAPTGVDPLHRMLTTASPTWTWVGPEDGHDLGVGAALLVGARGLLVGETEGAEPGLQLSPNIPAAWLGQGWEAHDLPTAHGRLSYAVRWHGERPALLWELTPWPGLPPVRLTAPGLDPAWTTTQATGEALLSPVALPEPPPTGGVSTPVTLERRPPKAPKPPKDKE